MSNSLRISYVHAEEVRKQYEYLNDVINASNGKTHRSHSHFLNNDILKLIIYYEVPEGRRELVRQKFNLVQSTHQSEEDNK
ncbi:MAG: hypothetical protein ACE5SW_08170 [Nitrososphaeraceae archaeon]